MSTEDPEEATMVTRLLNSIRTLTASLRPRRIRPIVPPVTVTDANDREVQIRQYSESDRNSLVTMYDDFDPTQRAQGVPPRSVEAIREWLSDALDGIHVVAAVNNKIVGHIGFVPDGTGRHELMIFVHPDYQQAGIGSDLIAAGLGHAEQAGVTYVWLSVEKRKRYQQQFYNRAGFSLVNSSGMTYRMSRLL